MSLITLCLKKRQYPAYVIVPMGLAFSCFQILCVCVLLSVHVLQKFHEFRMADFFILVVKKCVGVGACITRFTHGIEIRDFF